MAVERIVRSVVSNPFPFGNGSIPTHPDQIGGTISPTLVQGKRYPSFGSCGFGTVSKEIHSLASTSMFLERETRVLARDVGKGRIKPIPTFSLRIAPVLSESVPALGYVRNEHWNRLHPRKAGGSKRLGIGCKDILLTEMEAFSIGNSAQEVAKQEAKRNFRYSAPAVHVMFEIKRS